MRVIFFILLTANIAFYVWEVRSQHSEDGVRHIALDLPNATEHIKLLSEVPPPQAEQPPLPAEQLMPAPAPITPAKGAKLKISLQQPTQAVIAAANVQPAPPVHAPGCWLVGPFVTDMNARIAQEGIARKVPQTTLVNRSVGVADGYWLLYPRAANIEAGRDNRRLLQEKGIRDLWLFDRGELAGYISLGLFQTKEGVEDAQKKYFERNIATEIRPRETAIQGYWIEIPWQGGRSQLETVLGAFDKSGVSVSLRPC
ncbi:hypothetical protein F6R98_00690 [Candidatus Methylospira mobilis]|uniref:SPOR domain-containing protein n=1 Tax=Candidatus Methylospira mobilis TaxID=1808979 RepID=A0A5Q0BHL2_9GAMM|nr:hypothetical protein [Candidatus Methylospira mobilis]QFY41316.1 hypothetical protein F6R98_00690 [Candidatus Methylospira mobilis]WNV05459.1 hypothetical protein RP726_03355 [Candidatus Methylospira mobilis]